MSTLQTKDYIFKSFVTAVIKQSLSTQLTQSPPLPLFATCSSFTFFWIMASNNHLFLKNTVFHMVFNQVDSFYLQVLLNLRFTLSPCLWFVTWKYQTRQIWINDIYCVTQLKLYTLHKLSSTIFCCLWVSEWVSQASVSTYQISTFSNIYRHTSNLLTQYNI